VDSNRVERELRLMIYGHTPNAMAVDYHLSELGMIWAMIGPKIELHHPYNKDKHDVMVNGLCYPAHGRHQAKLLPALGLPAVIFLLTMPSAAAKCHLLPSCAKPWASIQSKIELHHSYSHAHKHHARVTYHHHFAHGRSQAKLLPATELHLIKI